MLQICIRPDLSTRPLTCYNKALGILKRTRAQRMGLMVYSRDFLLISKWHKLSTKVEFSISFEPNTALLMTSILIFMKVYWGVSIGICETPFVNRVVQ